MNIRTIWTIPAMSFGERVRRTREALTMQLAYHLPMRLQYWAVLHCINHVSSKLPKAVVGSITVDQIMKNMRQPEDAA